MIKDKPIKLVYSDGNNSNKAIKGLVISEDEFTVDIKALETGDILTIGKRFIIMSRPLQDGEGQ